MYVCPELGYSSGSVTAEFPWCVPTWMVTMSPASQRPPPEERTFCLVMLNHQMESTCDICEIPLRILLKHRCTLLSSRNCSTHFVRNSAKPRSRTSSQDQWLGKQDKVLYRQNDNYTSCSLKSIGKKNMPILSHQSVVKILIETWQASIPVTTSE